MIKMKINNTIILFIFMATLLMGCPAIDWKETNFTRSKPDTKNIVGTWIPTPDTLKYIREEGKYPEVKHELIIRADGTFSMRNMPDWWCDGFGRSNKGFESGDGNWRLEKRNNVWDIWMIQLDFPSYVTSVHLYGQKPPYHIFIESRIGDPNSGNAMFFMKI